MNEAEFLALLDKREAEKEANAKAAQEAKAALDAEVKKQVDAQLAAIAADVHADLVLIDAPDGGTQSDALSAIRHGDIAATGAVISAGEPRFVGRSRNTPATTRKVQVAKCTLPRDFSGAKH